MTDAASPPASPSPEAAFLVLPPGRWAWLLGLASAIVIASVALLYLRSHPMVAAAIALIALSCAAITLVGLAPPWQPLRLTQSGLSFATALRRFDLRWCELGAFGMAHLGAVRMVCVTYASAPSRKPRFGRFDWFLPSHYGMAAEGLARTLEHTRARFTDAPDNHEKR